MKELIAAIAGLGVLLYVMRNETAPSPILLKKTIEGFEPEILQNTLNLIQEKEVNVYPIDTVYFNRRQDGGSGYIGRFMFLNTDGFYGVQYDVETDGKTLFSLKKMVPPEYQNPFSGYTTRQTFQDIMNIKAPEVNMARVHEKLKTENIAGFYDKTRGDKIVSEMQNIIQQ
jgi:hypothetical protein